MGIKLVQKRNINAVEVISENDDALDLETSDFEEYKKTGDISHLKFIADKTPTKFICNFALKSNEISSIKNSMIAGSDSEGKPVVTLGSWSFKVVKTCLKDIINPSDLLPEEKIVFKRDSQGYCHEDVLVVLDQLGILNEIFSMYTTLTSTDVKANSKN